MKSEMCNLCGATITASSDDIVIAAMTQHKFLAHQIPLPASTTIEEVVSEVAAPPAPSPEASEVQKIISELESLETP